MDDYCEKHNIPLPSDEKIMYLVRGTLRLIEEINREVPPLKMQHRKGSRDETEPMMQSEHYSEEFVKDLEHIHKIVREKVVPLLWEEGILQVQRRCRRSSIFVSHEVPLLSLDTTKSTLF